MLRRSSLLVALATLSWVTPAAAQAYDFHPSNRVAATVDHLRVTDPDHRIFLYRLRGTSSGNLDGIDQKVWDGSSATGNWSAWTARTNVDVKKEGPFGSSVFALAGEYWSSTYAIYLPRFQAFFNYRNTTTPANENAGHRLAAPFWNWLDTAYNWLSLTPPAIVNPLYEDSPHNSSADMEPRAGFSWKNGSNLRMNVFGIASDWSTSYSGYSNVLWYNFVREAWYDGATWRFTNHGSPADWVELIRMGPNSAVWTDPTQVSRGYVFVSGNDGADLHHLFVNYFGPGCSGTATGWCWNDLGAPNYTTDMRTPTAVTYHIGSITRVAVFVAAKASGRWHLYGRYTDDRVNFTNWQDFGTPPTISYTSSSRDGFDLNVGVVYYLGSTLRINLFGYTEPYNTTTAGLTAHGGGHLIEFYWDGGTWRWGMDVMPPSPQNWNVQDQETWSTAGPRFQTMSASVVDTQTWDRLSVFGQDEYGATWEFYWAGNGWHWQRM